MLLPSESEEVISKDDKRRAGLLKVSVLPFAFNDAIAHCKEGEAKGGVTSPDASRCGGESQYKNREYEAGDTCEATF